MTEEWRDIDGYDLPYQVSNFGDIRNKDTGHVYKRRIGRTGYCCVTLVQEHLPTVHSVHRLVAKAFIPNPDNLPYINHKDEVRTNNIVENLEWCTPYYNAHYGSNHARIMEFPERMRQNRLARKAATIR